MDKQRINAGKGIDSGKPQHASSGPPYFLILSSLDGRGRRWLNRPFELILATNFDSTPCRIPTVVRYRISGATPAPSGSCAHCQWYARRYGLMLDGAVDGTVWGCPVTTAASFEPLCPHSEYEPSIVLGVVN